VNLIVREIYDCIDEDTVIEMFDPDSDRCSCCGRYKTSALAVLFSKLTSETATKPCNTHAVELVGVLFGTLPMGIAADMANGIIIRMMNLDLERLLVEVRDKDGRWLRTTKRGERQLGVHINVELDETTKSRLRRSPVRPRMSPGSRPRLRVIK
jgi:hypothetical protein